MAAAAGKCYATLGLSVGEAAGMLTSDIRLSVADGVTLFVYCWRPEAAPKAAIQIAHGLSEHGGRYARLAAALTGAGYVVYGSDHRGHGRTAPTAEDLGFFAEREGWRRCLDDLWQVNRRIAADHPKLPILLIGHSMGSFLTQDFICDHGDALAGTVLCGSDGKPEALAVIGRLIVRLERLRLGPRGRSGLIQSLTFGTFNKSFAPSRTAVDWLSRDPAEVDKYLADPLCGFAATTQLWVDLLDALGAIARPERQALIPKPLPIYVIAGTADPVSAGTRRLQQLLAAYRAAGLQHVTHRFYADARHELFNETNRDEVTRDLIGWLDGVLATAAAPAHA
jgi:alpha-beta hydrolase superfamily lysophospholipase